MADLYVPRDHTEVVTLVDAFPLCWIVTGGPEDRLATPLPLLVETDSEGRPEALLGHIGRSHAQRAALERDPRASVLCIGPQAYISPRLVSNLTWAPTWNYAACRFEVEVQFVPDETGSALFRLAAALEGSGADAWTPNAMGSRYEQLKERIIAFRARIQETHARFKLGQDEPDLTFREITEGLADRQLAEWMRRTRA